MEKEKIAIVIPTIREDCILRFLKEWKVEFSKYENLNVIIVEDNPQKTFKIEGDNIIHYSWKEIDGDLKENSWIIPRRTDCVRSYGYYKAYKSGTDFLITLDDDCYPTQTEPYLIELFIKHLKNQVGNDWFNTLSGRMENHSGFYPRGFPYKNRNKPVVLCHGLWNNVPDFDGQTQLANPGVRIKAPNIEATTVPHNVFFPMCGMNMAIRREAIPSFYFLLMGKDKNDNRWGFDRFGDIWCGIFIKKIIDHLEKAAVSGYPIIHHDRASNAQKNAELEIAGLEINEWLYKEVEKIQLTSQTFKSCYRELAEKLPAKNNYFSKLKKAMIIWSELF